MLITVDLPPVAFSNLLKTFDWTPITIPEMLITVDLSRQSHFPTYSKHLFDLTPITIPKMLITVYVSPTTSSETFVMFS